MKKELIETKEWITLYEYTNIKDNIDILSRYYEYMKQRNLSDNTITAYIQKLKIYISSIGDKSIQNADYDDIYNYMNLFDKYGPAEKNQASTAVRMFYRWMLTYDLIDYDPTKRLVHVKENKKLPVFLTSDEISRMYETFDTTDLLQLRNKALLAFMFSTGARVSEVVNAKISNITEYNQDIHLIKILGKGKKERIVPISPFAYNLLKEYWSKLDFEPEYLFSACHYNHYKKEASSYNNRISRTMCLYIIKDAAKNAGIEKTISPHKIRHSFATELLNNGMEINTISELLGHSSVRTTQIYAHLNFNKKISDCAKYHSDYNR